MAPPNRRRQSKTWYVNTARTNKKGPRITQAYIMQGYGIDHDEYKGLEDEVVRIITTDQARKMIALGKGRGEGWEQLKRQVFADIRQVEGWQDQFRDQRIDQAFHNATLQTVFFSAVQRTRRSHIRAITAAHALISDFETDGEDDDAPRGSHRPFSRNRNGGRLLHTADTDDEEEEEEEENSDDERLPRTRSNRRRSSSVLSHVSTGSVGENTLANMILTDPNREPRQDPSKKQIGWSTALILSTPTKKVGYIAFLEMLDVKYVHFENDIMIPDLHQNDVLPHHISYDRFCELLEDRYPEHYNATVHVIKDKVLNIALECQGDFLSAITKFCRRTDDDWEVVLVDRNAVDVPRVMFDLPGPAEEAGGSRKRGLGGSSSTGAAGKRPRITVE